MNVIIDKNRKKTFQNNVSNLLKGISYEKTRTTYDIHSDNFTMFIYFGKRNTVILDAAFTGRSNYYFGSMNEEEIKDAMLNEKEFTVMECERYSRFMIEDLVFHFGENYNKYIKLKIF